MPAYRRYWILVLCALLFLPLVAGGFAKKKAATDEQRNLAAAPAMPHSAAAAIALPREIDAYLRDHFGLRAALIHLHAVLTHQLLRSGNKNVLPGRDGWMFLRSDDTIRQSAGDLIREARVAGTADVIADARDRLALDGVKLVFAATPNSATIYPEFLPARVANTTGRRTEYDAMLAALAGRGVRAVDLRPALRAARAGGTVYLKHDTHWSPRGVVAGFDAMAAATGHADWQVDAERVLAPPVEVEGGDLARLLATAREATEEVQPLALPRKPVEFLVDSLFSVFRSTGGMPGGPSILVIGDSFTSGDFQPLVLRGAANFYFIHHHFCKFDWGWVEQFHPDEVWWMPTERQMLCEAGARPAGLAAGR